MGTKFNRYCSVMYVVVAMNAYYGCFKYHHTKMIVYNNVMSCVHAKIESVGSTFTFRIYIHEQRIHSIQYMIILKRGTSN